MKIFRDKKFGRGVPLVPYLFGGSCRGVVEAELCEHILEHRAGRQRGQRYSDVDCLFVDCLYSICSFVRGQVSHTYIVHPHDRENRG